MYTSVWRNGLIILIVASLFSTLYAQDKPAEGRPPAQVVISKVETGTVAPEVEFVGTVYFAEVSDVATEVDGRIDVVDFEEGQGVKRGQVLVKLNTDLLQKSIESTRASHGQVMSEFEKARIDLERNEKLYKKGAVAKQEYDTFKFRVKALEHSAASLEAQVERLEVERQRASIRAPFDGVVVKKEVARGEWLSEGSTVATIARDDALDVVVEVPEEVLRFIKPGMDVRVRAGGTEATGALSAIIPRGSVSTRTFPVKIRVTESSYLLEGMEARVRLPVGPRRDALIVPRDAVVTMFGNNVVFTVVDAKAKMIAVKVEGYQGMTVGIVAQGLSAGMHVVVKGNERLMDEQRVIVAKEPD